MGSQSISPAGTGDGVAAAGKPIWWIIAAVLLFLLSRAYILAELTPLVTDVPYSYFREAALVVDLHKSPYSEVAIEYPPLAWWITCIPRLLDQHTITEPENIRQVEPIRKSYHNTYRIMMFFCDLLCFPLLLAIAWKRRRDLAGWAVLAYTIVTASLGHLLYDRLDLPLLLLLLLWAYCWIRSLGTSGRLGWAAAAYSFMGLSISLKLIPVVAVPFLLLADFHGLRRATRLAVGLLCLATAACLPFFIQYLVSGPAVFSVFSHHAERGIQIESIYASAILLASLLGTPITVASTHGAYEVSCAGRRQ